MQQEERESDLASCYWAARLILLGCCECLNYMKQSSDLWSGCVFPTDTLMPFSGPEWVTICIFLLLIISCISYWLWMPCSVAEKLAVLPSSEALNSAELFFSWGKSSKCEYRINTFFNCDYISKPQKSGGSQTFLLLAPFSVIDLNVLSFSLPNSHSQNPPQENPESDPGLCKNHVPIANYIMEFCTLVFFPLLQCIPCTYAVTLIRSCNKLKCGKKSVHRGLQDSWTWKAASH